ncbi:MAG: hypothetical protein C4551_10195 [Bacillota bacterium]|nr:MAG: hypothetical protein C4551_10195 [Bacillota bacterium]
MTAAVPEHIFAEREELVARPGRHILGVVYHLRYQPEWIYEDEAPAEETPGFFDDCSQEAGPSDSGEVGSIATPQRRIIPRGKRHRRDGRLRKRRDRGALCEAEPSRLTGGCTMVRATWVRR